MHLTRELLNAALLYLLPDEPDAHEIRQHAQNILDALRRQAESPSADQLGLSETFLRMLSDVAHQHSSAVMRQQAVECLHYVASERGLTSQQLEDRLVPDCGLDGSVVFDYGARHFTLVLGNDHTALLRDQRGRLRTGLPRQLPTDDAKLVARAATRWRTHKRRLSQASRTQAARLEQAMIDGQRWTPAELTNILGHPLLAELAGRLIWAGYTSEGALLETFCLTDKHSPASETYAPIELQRYATIGLPHPASVAPERRLRWAEMLSDFHIALLFPQAGRPVFTLNATEQQTAMITRFQALSLRAGALQSALSQYGWGYQYTRSIATRWFAGARVMSTIELTGDASTQHIIGCTFEYAAAEPDQKMQKLALRDVDPVVLSEVLWHMSEIAASPKLREQL